MTKLTINDQSQLNIVCKCKNKVNDFPLSSKKYLCDIQIDTSTKTYKHSRSSLSGCCSNISDEFK